MWKFWIVYIVNIRSEHSDSIIILLDRAEEQREMFRLVLRKRPYHSRVSHSHTFPRRPSSKTMFSWRLNTYICEYVADVTAEWGSRDWYESHTTGAWRTAGWIRRFLCHVCSVFFKPKVSVLLSLFNNSSEKNLFGDVSDSPSHEYNIGKQRKYSGGSVWTLYLMCSIQVCLTRN